MTLKIQATSCLLRLPKIKQRQSRSLLQSAEKLNLNSITKFIKDYLYTSVNTTTVVHTTPITDKL